MNQERASRVLQNLRDMGMSQLIVTDPTSIGYLTGYTTDPYERLFALYLAEKDGELEDILFCNVLFPDATGAASRVVTFSDTDDYLGLLAEVVNPDQVLGVDKEMPARWIVPLLESGAAKSVRLGSAAVDDARSVKDSEEQELMRTASKINDQAMEWLASQVHVGTTEAEIASGLLGEYRRLGAEDHSFTPIVSFGANAADPHHEPDGTVLEPGDMVLFDVGCKYHGYCSDMTRTLFTAEPTERQLEVYDTVRRANEAAEALIRPGVLFSELDLAARKVIEDAGYGEYFTHRLGHQIGLQDHEPGDVSSSHAEPVRVGQCFSIEPGIYIPGEIGVRIEDLVIVTEDGAEILNRYVHEPVTLDA